MRKCQALVYAPGCWRSDKGTVPEEPHVAEPGPAGFGITDPRLPRGRHRAAASATASPGSPGPVLLPMPQFPPWWGRKRARSTSPHAPALARWPQCHHATAGTDCPWLRSLVPPRGCHRGGAKHTASVTKATGAASLGCDVALPSSPIASRTPYVPVHGLMGGTGAPAPWGRGPWRCHPHAEKGTGDVAERFSNIQPVGFPAARTHQVSALNTALLQD